MDRRLDLDGLPQMARQLDRQFRSAFGPVDGADLAAEILNDAVGDRQPQSQSLAHRLGGEKRIEDAADLLGRNAMPVVGNADGDGSGGGTNQDPDPWLA